LSPSECPKRLKTLVMPRLKPTPSFLKPDSTSTGSGRYSVGGVVGVTGSSLELESRSDVVDERASETGSSSTASGVCRRIGLEGFRVLANSAVSFAKVAENEDDVVAREISECSEMELVSDSMGIGAEMGLTVFKAKSEDPRVDRDDRRLESSDTDCEAREFR